MAGDDGARVLGIASVKTIQARRNINSRFRFARVPSLGLKLNHAPQPTAQFIQGGLITLCGMVESFRTVLQAQLGAAIDMLENAMQACPPEVWGHKRTGKHEFWYLAYHTLYWLESDLTAPEKHVPMNGFKAKPERVYTQAELLEYLEHNREKMHARLDTLSETELRRTFKDAGMTFTVLEILLYALRHVQHHTAQLNLLLRQQTDSAPKWVRRAATR